MIDLRRKIDTGVTLIELMIVLVIAAFLVAGIYSLFITQHRSYSVQDQVAGVQQDARAALDIMARDIRMAGFVVGAGSGSGFTDGTPPSFAINGFNYAVNPINSNAAPDTLTVVLGIEEWGNVLSVGSEVTLDRNVDSDCGFVAFDLLPGRIFQASAADDNNPQITATNVPTGSKIEEGKAYGVQAITYSVTIADGTLRRNTGDGAQPLAGDGINTFVEDLQFAYQVSGDAGWYNDPLTDFPAGKTRADIRMIRINIIVKTAVADPKETGFFKPACEDRGQANSDPGNRRRVYTTEVKVRNL
ncbi:MAG: prepilin-type N-terminal cleavage/methylation domain-containing protein [Desulfobacterales bacterium]|nr:prepilin-type N-terminal cleavage/methylation domain-containing protein [Desulfobacterales bacterium]